MNNCVYLNYQHHLFSPVSWSRRFVVTFKVITAVLVRLRVLWEVALCCWVRVSKKSNGVVIYRVPLRRRVALTWRHNWLLKKMTPVIHLKAQLLVQSVCFRTLSRARPIRLTQPLHTSLTFVVMPQLATANKEPGVLPFPSKYFS